MTELPKTWIRMPLGEVGRWFGGGTPSKANPLFWTGGSIPWVSPKDMKCDLITDAQDHITEEAVAKSATNLVEAGSVLLVVRSGILQHTLPVAVAGRQVALNQDLKAVKPRENVRSDYLALALKAFERDILHTCTKTGTTVQSLELLAFLRFEIPVAPLDEQHQIVAEIEKQFTRLETGIAALRRVQANLKRYRAAVLKAACEGHLVPTETELARKEGGAYESADQLLARILTERREKWKGRGKYKEPIFAMNANVPPLPDGWTWASLDQLLLNITDGDHQPPPQTNSGVPFLVIGNVRSGRIYLTGTRYVSRAYADAVDPFRKPTNGDILYTLVGSFGLAVRVTRDDEFCIQRHIAVLRPHEASPVMFLAQVLNSSFVFQQASAAATGTAQKTVPLAGLRRFAIPLPPLAEQERIVAEVERRLSVVEEQEAVVSANLRRATRLRQAVLQRAFSP